MRFGQPEKRPRAQRTQEKAKQQAPVVRPKRALQVEGLTEESQIDFDPIEGHRHDGADSRAVPLSGDVTGSNTGSTVGAIQGVPIAEPTVDDDQRVPRYSSGTNSITWEPPLVAHNLLSIAHTDTTAASPVRGDLVTGQGASPTWSRLALGLTGRVVKSDGTDVTWGQVGFSELTGSLSAGQHGALSTGATHTLAGDLSGTTATAAVDRVKGKAVTTPSSAGTYAKYDGAGIVWDVPAVGNHALLSAPHSDTTAASPVRGDLITGQGASPKFARLALGVSGRVVKSDGTDVTWGQVAFSELTGSLTDAQHGALSSSSSHAVGGDLSGTTASATVAKLQNKAVTAPVAPTHTNQYLQFNGTSLVWSTPAAGAGPHNLLSSVHPDTTAASAVRGDLVTAQGASPTWSRLAVGASGRVLRSNGTDPAWAQLSHADLDPASITANQHHNQAHTFFGSDHSDVSGTPAAGALIYRNGSSQWVPLTVGSTDQILKVSGGGLPVWAAANTVATSRSPVYGWRRANISSGADPTFKEMPGFDAVNTGERMAYAGTLVGISVVLDGDIGALGQDYTVECYRATSDAGAYAATGVTCTIAGGGGTERSASATGFSVAFNAGDILTVYDKRTSGVNGRSSKCHLLVVFS